MDIASNFRCPAGRRLRGGWAAVRVPALALAATLAVAGSAEAGGRHHQRHGGGDGAAWFALGSLVTFLAVAHANPAPIVHPPRHYHRRHWRGPVVPSPPWHSHRHRHHRNPHVHYRHPGGGHRFQTGHGGHHRRADGPPPRALSDRHRHGNGAWHVHPLGHPRAHHRH